MAQRISRTIDMMLDDDVCQRLSDRARPVSDVNEASSSSSEPGQPTSPQDSPPQQRTLKQHRSEQRQSRKQPPSATFALFKGSSATLPSVDGSQATGNDSQDDASMFASGLDRHRQQQDSHVEGLLFVIGAGVKQASFSNLMKIVSFLDDNPQVVWWARRGGAASSVVELVGKIRPRSGLGNVALVTIIHVLSQSLPGATVVQESTFSVINDVITKTLAPTDSGLGGEKIPPSRRQHWSRSSKVASDSLSAAAPEGSDSCLSQHDHDRLLKDVRKLWSQCTLADAMGVATPEQLASRASLIAAVSAAVLCRDIVVSVSFTAAESSNDTLRHQVARHVACSGLWQTAAKSIAVHSGAGVTVDCASDIGRFLMQAIEVTTCAPEVAMCLRGATDPTPLYTAVVQIMGTLSNDTDCNSKHLMLKLFINLTTAFPHGIEGITTNRNALLPDLAHVVQRCARQGDMDGVSLVVCLLLNLLTIQPVMDAKLRESQQREASARAQFINLLWQTAIVGNDVLIDECCRLVVKLHGETETNVESHVTAGYIAMFLGAASLGDEAARLTIVRHLANQCDPSAVELVAHPLRLIAAIVQEFVLFQSTAGILTKAALISMHGIAAQLLAENGGTSSRHAT